MKEIVSLRNPFGYVQRKMPVRKTGRRRVVCIRTPQAAPVLPAQLVKAPQIPQSLQPCPAITTSLVMSILDPSSKEVATVSQPPPRASGLPATMRMIAWDMPVPATPSAQLNRYLLNKEPFSSQYSDHNLFYSLLPKRLIERPVSVADKIALGAGFTAFDLAAAVLRISGE